MDRIQGDNVYATEDKKFTEGNPAQGIPATVVTAKWLNTVQEELANLVEGLGLALDEEAQDQLITGLFGLAHTYTAAQGYAQKLLAITDHAVTWNCSAVPSAILHLTEDVTSLTITNYLPGAAYDLTIAQDATGGWACTMPADVLWADCAGYEVTPDAKAVDRIYNAPVTDPNDAKIKPLLSVEYNYGTVS